MYEYEMDPTKIVVTTERTGYAGRTDGRTDRQTDGWMEWNQYATPTTSLCGGYNKTWNSNTPVVQLIEAEWHIYVSKLTNIGSDNGLSPSRCQAIISTNAGMLLIGPLGTNFSEILIEIYMFSFKKMQLNMSSGIWQPFCLSLNVLIRWCISTGNIHQICQMPWKLNCKFIPFMYSRETKFQSNYAGW